MDAVARRSTRATARSGDDPVRRPGRRRDGVRDHASGRRLQGHVLRVLASKTELIAQLREAMIADHQMQMAKAIADNSPLGLTSDFSPEAVEVAIDFLSSELHAVLFPTAADQAQGQREVVRSYEDIPDRHEQQGDHQDPGPLLVRSTARRCGELRRRVQPRRAHLRPRHARLGNRRAPTTRTRALTARSDPAW